MTPEQTALLAKRQSAFREFHAERLPELIEFIDKIGIQPSHHVATNAAAYLPSLGQVLRDMRCETAQERTLLSARVAEYVGEYFAQRFGGGWYVDEAPDSPAFGRYVVGRFSAAPGSTAWIDPFEVGMVFARLPRPRDLAALIAAAEQQLNAAVTADASPRDPAAG